MVRFGNMETFTRMVEIGSISAVAVNWRLKELEQHLGVELLKGAFA